MVHGGVILSVSCLGTSILLGKETKEEKINTNIKYFKVYLPL